MQSLERDKIPNDFRRSYAFVKRSMRSSQESGPLYDSIDRKMDAVRNSANLKIGLENMNRSSTSVIKLFTTNNSSVENSRLSLPVI